MTNPIIYTATNIEDGIEAHITIPGYIVKIGGTVHAVKTVEAARDKWNAYREETGQGVSEIGNGAAIKTQCGKFVARISYNGRIWSTPE